MDPLSAPDRGTVKNAPEEDESRAWTREGRSASAGLETRQGKYFTLTLDKEDEIGILVDSVPELLHFKGKPTEKSLTFGIGLSNGYTSGMAKRGGVKTFLDIDKVMNREQMSTAEVEVAS